jgi:chromosome segregation ATPase
MIHENTIDDWSGVVADLTAKRQAAHEHLQQLRAQKRELALEAAMGGGEAKKRLERTNAELSKLAFEIDDWDVAIVQAQAEKEQAEKSLAEVAEQARQKELSMLALAAVRHAAEYTASLRQAVKAGAALKMVVAHWSMRRHRLPRREEGSRRWVCGVLDPPVKAHGSECKAWSGENGQRLWVGHQRNLALDS